MEEKSTILVVTGDDATRGPRILKKIDIDELALTINVFVDQMGQILEKTPQNMGKYALAEFEISAEITAKGSLAILGTGGEAGGTGGIKFVFRRS